MAAYRPDLLKVLGELYESEINAGMSSFWDNGFRVWIGDDMNGRVAERKFYRSRRTGPDTFKAWPASGPQRRNGFTTKQSGSTQGQSTRSVTRGEDDTLTRGLRFDALRVYKASIEFRPTTRASP